MTIFFIVLGIVLAIAALLSYVVKLNRKPKAVAPVEISKKAFNIIMNYVTSFVNTYGGKDYIFLSISIENKTDNDLDDVVIETIPSLPIITDLRYRAISEKWNIDSQDPVFSDSLLSRVASIEPGAMVTGYIVVETKNAHCNIDTISISAGDQVQEIPIRKDRVVFKRNMKR